MSSKDTVETAADLIAANLSVAREKILESRLLSELSVFMLRRGTMLDVLKGQIDAQGHDVVLEAAGIIRHVQLKATVNGGKRAEVDISVKLRAKPSGCVIWMSYDPVTLTITDYRWFGGEPGAPLPDIGDKVTRHTRGTRAGRPSLRNVRKSRFERVGGLEELAPRLFGPQRTAATSLVFSQLRERFGMGWQERLSLSPEPTSFHEALEFAHLVDGYRVLEQLCEVDAPGWVDRMAEQGRSQQFSTDVGLLWTQLFVEHRRWRAASPYEPCPEELLYLDELARRTGIALDRELRREAA